MKNSALLSHQKCADPRPARFLSAVGLILGAACLAWLAPAARAQDSDIGVRSKVMDKDLQRGHKTSSLEDGGHGKTFAIVAIDEVKSESRLVRPVDQENILEQLYEQLLANGFTTYAKGTKPDILLAVSYCRGEMSNPYLRGAAGVTGDLTGATPGIPNVFLSGADQIGQAVIDHRTPGLEVAQQKAGFEKLFIRVTAFAYPTDPKAKPKMLWKTIIVADDPDHRDLKKPEIPFDHGVPQGSVNVGTAEAVKTDVKK